MGSWLSLYTTGLAQGEVEGTMTPAASMESMDFLRKVRSVGLNLYGFNLIGGLDVTMSTGGTSQGCLKSSTLVAKHLCTRSNMAFKERC